MVLAQRPFCRSLSRQSPNSAGRRAVRHVEGSISVDVGVDLPPCIIATGQCALGTRCSHQRMQSIIGDSPLSRWRLLLFLKSLFWMSCAMFPDSRLIKWNKRNGLLIWILDVFIDTSHPIFPIFLWHEHYFHDFKANYNFESKIVVRLIVIWSYEDAFGTLFTCNGNLTKKMCWFHQRCDCYIYIFYV